MCLVYTNWSTISSASSSVSTMAGPTLGSKAIASLRCWRLEKVDIPYREGLGEAVPKPSSPLRTAFTAYWARTRSTSRLVMLSKRNDETPKHDEPLHELTCSVLQIESGGSARRVTYSQLIKSMAQRL